MNAKPDFPKITSTELDLIGRIGDRAREMTKGKIVRPKSAWVMDIDAWHSKEPLDLQKLLDFDTFNFLHDVIGIMNHLDRRTGEIDHRFMPRSAR